MKLGAEGDLIMDDVMQTLEVMLREMGVRAASLHAGLHIEDDLGIESLGRVELAMKLEKRFKKPVSAHINDLPTLGDLIGYLNAK
jgi:acyl carrier protein